MTENIYQQGLTVNAANHAPLTPLTFLKRTAAVYPNQTAVIHGPIRRSWAETEKRCLKMASALQSHGIGRGDTVAIMAPNIPEFLEMHFAVPMTGAVLNSLNTRLDPEALAFMLDHGEAKILFADREFGSVIRKALELSDNKPLLIEIDDPVFGSPDPLSDQDYESFLASGDAQFTPIIPDQEEQAICLNYTSGTTGNPKGVVYSHRGAYLNSLGNAITWPMPHFPVYLWTLPMFHCNGWCFPWTITALAGTHVCLRKVEANAIFEAISRHKVTHLCGAPIVMGMLINADPSIQGGFDHSVSMMTAAAAPPASVMSALEDLGIQVTHVYGLTEVYGPAVICSWHPEWDALPLEERARMKARQGVAYETQEDLMVADPDSMTPVPKDGETIGEIMMRGNIMMKGYLKNESATREAFEGGWFHTGDLAVWHENGYVEIKDRSKDIIISGGENISSIEVEDALYRHPAVGTAAVVAKKDEKWGETPVAFIELKPGHEVSADEMITFCRDHLAHFKCPRHVVFTEIPKTSTGKIQKFSLREEANQL